jgi:hypothetical protein
MKEQEAIRNNPSNSSLLSQATRQTYIAIPYMRPTPFPPSSPYMELLAAADPYCMYNSNCNLQWGGV